MLSHFNNKVYWQNLCGCAISFAIANNIESNPVVIITPDVFTINILEQELKFFLEKNKANLPVLVFPDWETLPYDHFSPNEEVVSQRLLTLHKILSLKSGIVIVALTTLMYRLAPKEHIEVYSFSLSIKEEVDFEGFYKKLDNCRYKKVSKVLEHGEFAVRGSIIDIFPVGSKRPFRIDFIDNEIDSIRVFDPNTQLSYNKVDKIQVLPAKEYSLDSYAINLFRQSWRARFSSDSLQSPIYQSVINQENCQGIEYYLPLFFEKTSSFFDYLPSNSILIRMGNDIEIMEGFWQTIKDRYEQLRHNQVYPLLSPSEIFIPVDQIFAEQNKFPQLFVNSKKYENNTNITKGGDFTEKSGIIYFDTYDLDDISIDNNAKEPLANLQIFLKNNNTPTASILFVAESAGRREALIDLLKTIKIDPVVIETWQDFIDNPGIVAITIAKISRPLHLKLKDSNSNIYIITETQIFGEQVIQPKISKEALQNSEMIIRNLVELQIGMPVVHFDYGIGRYLGLQKLPLNDYEAEFLVLEYADQNKLYVPVSSLNLISRYTGTDSEHTPLNHLGSKQWEKSKRDAKLKVRDVAAELLEIYARRANSRGFSFVKPGLDYERFVNSFKFEETPDQKRAIDEVIVDMESSKPMDRLICGDVGFGKTEVAMRAAFLAVTSNKQVAILAPTTILANQHFANFQDRFVGWPINLSLFSRFSSNKEQKSTLTDLASGKIDIVIGTHKLLQKNVKFKNLGLLVIDEEHRFGVKQKEYIKQTASNIDTLALTATPIPRTLSMAFANIRNFSIIATPPAKRFSIRTFVCEKNDYLIKEALVREISRGGQVYFLHNNIPTLEKVAQELQQLAPTARIAIAHGQMRKQQLEQIMHKFYHLHINVLVCTTIIESGIDIPTANTIIIDRADRFGLAQLHQLRGRVGRSYHQAYAYLLTPPPTALTADAKKRLEAIASMEDLGAGFVLATHDLEIRGAGELLGENQSGEIQSIGFSLYMEMLEQAVLALKNDQEIDIDAPPKPEIEVDLQIPALIPDKYIDDVNLRLVLYKRISEAGDKKALDTLQIEMIDRFGLLPEFTKNLFRLAEIRLIAKSFGVLKIIMGKNKGMIEFSMESKIDPKIIIKLIQKHPQTYKLKGSYKIEFNIEQDIIRINFINDFLSMLI